jgi:hypothetical protein
MSPVVNKIQDLGVQVVHIPAGCTSICQPVDGGIGKPQKDRFTLDDRMESPARKINSGHEIP